MHTQEQLDEAILQERLKWVKKVGILDAIKALIIVFNSQKEVDEYLASDRWQNKVPKKYGCRPEVQAVLDIGAILFKEKVISGKDSWISP